ncbi:uncharacterized protein EDB93DRAFT_1057060, partial [Suillus bovinus]|uniref:uncharacterized protein n=1 Tax=Suillus bovinus TaxID=48563 RepID=UPI001B86CB28
IFSDSAKDAKEEGRTCQQMTMQKNMYLQQLATAVFENDEDLKVREYFHVKPLGFTKPITSQFTLLCKRYNEVNVQLGKTGAGLSFEELNENEKQRVFLVSFIDHLLMTFPWWADLHGWWRMNPAYNTSFSMADPGQDFAAEAATL